MIFLSLFKVLCDRHAVITVELKNDIQLRGTYPFKELLLSYLHSDTIETVDQYLNIQLGNVEVVDKQRYPHLIPISNCFIRGSVIRYIHLSKLDVDEDLLMNISFFPRKTWISSFATLLEQKLQSSLTNCSLIYIFLDSLFYGSFLMNIPIYTSN